MQSTRRTSSASLTGSDPPAFAWGRLPGTARCAGRARSWHREPGGELDTGRRHPGLFRQHQPRMADAVRRTPGRRPARITPDPQMADGWRGGGWGKAAGDEGHPPRLRRARLQGRSSRPPPSQGQAVTGEHLSPLRLRSMGRAVAATPCARRDGRGARSLPRRRPGLTTRLSAHGSGLRPARGHALSTGPEPAPSEGWGRAVPGGATHPDGGVCPGTTP